jgi:hypothetical protein
MKISKIAGVALAALLSFQASNALAQVAAENVPGSALIFPKFDISGTNATQIRITNTSDLQVPGAPLATDLRVKLNYVCPGVKDVDQRCRALNRLITLTPHQTRVIDVAAHNPPCEKGFVVAFAVDAVDTDDPISWNFLIGSYNLTVSKETEAENAVAVQAVPPAGIALAGDPNLVFDGVSYRQLPTTLYTDFLGRDAAVPSGSRLVVLSLDTLAGQQNPPTQLMIDFWNAVEVPFSTSLEYVCWVDVALEDIDVNFEVANLETTYGSMLIDTIPNCPIPGGCPPMIQYDPVIIGAITEYAPGLLSGRTLQHDESPKSTTYSPR